METRGRLSLIECLIEMSSPSFTYYKHYMPILLNVLVSKIWQFVKHFQTVKLPNQFSTMFLAVLYTYIAGKVQILQYKDFFSCTCMYYFFHFDVIYM